MIGYFISFVIGMAAGACLVLAWALRTAEKLQKENERGGKEA